MFNFVCFLMTINSLVTIALFTLFSLAYLIKLRFTYVLVHAQYYFLGSKSAKVVVFHVIKLYVNDLIQNWLPLSFTPYNIVCKQGIYIVC